MKNRNRKTYTPILEEASYWFVEFNEGEVDAAGKEAFAHWLRASPEHVSAYLQVSALWEDAPFMAKHAWLDAEALIAHACAQENIISISLPRPEPEAAANSAARVPKKLEHTKRFSRWRAPVKWVWVALPVVAAAAFAVWTFAIRGVYSTEVGEQRLLTLADGSTVDLNARSRLRVHFTNAERTVYLLEGEALFHVAHNPDRPFVVHSDSTRVRAVGTAFDVYRRKGGTTVTVVEGRVAVLAGDSSARDDAERAPEQLPGHSGAADTQRSESKLLGVSKQASSTSGATGLLLAAGEQATVGVRGETSKGKADVSAATAWTQRRLVFNSSPLSEVVDQYNRYNARPLIIRDPAVASLNISGVFAVGDSASLIAFLREQSGVRLIETDAGIEIAAE